MGLLTSFIAKFTVVSFVLAATIFLVKHSFQFDIRNFFTGPGSLSRLVLLFVALANLKAAPLVWHARLIGAIYRHHVAAKPQQKKGVFNYSGSAIFQPIITTSRSPLAECDLNFHKSNATFFSDLDITRTHLLSHHFTEGVRKLRMGESLVFGRDGKIARGSVKFCLGASHCTFKKEIAPYEAYEMWSRILSWDSKWIYIVTHFVRKGAASPADHAAIKEGQAIVQLQGEEKASNGMSNDVFASAISKQVVKLGRISVDPEIVFAASGLMPTKSTTDVSNNTHGIGDSAAQDRERVEGMRQRGLMFAEHLGALDGLLGEFFPGNISDTRRFSDLF